MEYLEAKENNFTSLENHSIVWVKYWMSMEKTKGNSERDIGNTLGSQLKNYLIRDRAVSQLDQGCRASSPSLVPFQPPPEFCSGGLGDHPEQILDFGCRGKKEMEVPLWLCNPIAVTI